MRREKRPASFALTLLEMKLVLSASQSHHVIESLGRVTRLSKLLRSLGTYEREDVLVSPTLARRKA